MCARGQVDDIGEVTITNDGATILKELEVEHPAARTLVELAERQDKEVGDGTTSVVILAAELLKVGVAGGVRVCFVAVLPAPPPRHARLVLFCIPRYQRANELVRQKIHPTTIISGFRLPVPHAPRWSRPAASVIKCVVGYMSGPLVHPNGQDGAGLLGQRRQGSLTNCPYTNPPPVLRPVLLPPLCLPCPARFIVLEPSQLSPQTAMSSKIIGTANDFFANMAVDAVTSVRHETPEGKVSYSVKAINILKSHGKSATEVRTLQNARVCGVVACVRGV